MESSVLEILRPEHLTEATARWGEGDAPRLIGDVENFVYAWERDGEAVILRLTHSSHRTREQVMGELAWIDHLYQGGAPACRPIPSRSGAIAEVISAGETYFVAALFERAPGRPARPDDPALWNADLFREWGRVTGRMHALTKGYDPASPELRRPRVEDEELIASATRYLPASDTAVLRELNETVAWLRTLPRERDGYGLIHGDLHHGNFLVDEGRIAVFDFDDCGYFWFVADVAIPLYYILHGIPPEERDRRAQVAKEFLTPFWEGYSEENALDPTWLGHIPRFHRFRDLELYVFCHKKADPERLAEWRFFQRVRANLAAGPPEIRFP